MGWKQLLYADVKRYLGLPEEAAVTDVAEGKDYNKGDTCVQEFLCVKVSYTLNGEAKQQLWYGNLADFLATVDRWGSNG